MPGATPKTSRQIKRVDNLRSSNVMKGVKRKVNFYEECLHNSNMQDKVLALTDSISGPVELTSDVMTMVNGILSKGPMTDRQTDNFIQINVSGRPLYGNSAAIEWVTLHGK